jgi:hypothetical protein
MLPIEKINAIKILVAEKIPKQNEFFIRHILFSLSIIDWEEVFKFYLTEFPDEYKNPLVKELLSNREV